MPKASGFCLLVYVAASNIPQANALNLVTTIFNMQTTSASPPVSL